MANSNAIRSALKIMNRVYELRAAGLKLKESKSDLRVVLLELRNELPAEILFNVEKVLSRRSGRDFFSHLSTVIYCAEAALRVAEQMDGYHAEALRMNDAIDNDRGYSSLSGDDADFCRGVRAEKQTKEMTRQHQEHHERREFWFHCQSVRDGLIAAAHTEALAINAAFDSSFHRRAANWGAMDWMSREIELEKAHAEALEENARFDWLTNRWGLFHASIRWVQAEMINADHRAALRMEAEIGTATIEAHL